MLITFDTFSGLAPIEGTRTKTATRATVCENISLRKGDIRPLRTPVATTRTIDPNPSALIENPNTGTVFSGTFGDGLVVDQFRSGGLAYAVLDGVKSLLQYDSVVGPYFPARPTTAPSVVATPQVLGATYNIGDELDAISNVVTPVNQMTIAEPQMIIHQRGTPAGTEYPAATIMAALDYVLNNYQVKFADPLLASYTFAQIIGEMIEIIDTKPVLTRIWNQSGTSQMRVEFTATNYMDTVEEALKSAINSLTKAVYRELTGSWDSSLFDPITFFVPKQLESPEAMSYGWVLNLRQTLDTTPIGSGGPYATAPGVVVQVGTTVHGLDFIGHYVGAVWRQNATNPTGTYTSAAVRDVFNLSCIECAAARAATVTYVWYGLYGSTFTNTGQLDPFVVGTDRLRPNTEEYSAPIPRAYCYTWVDQWGRESRPSEPVVVTGQNDLGSWAVHEVTCPDVPPPEVGLVVIYRMTVPHEAADAEALTGQWVRVAIDTVANASTGVVIPDVGDAGYGVLSTVLDEPHPDTPKFLCATEEGHSVCTDTAKTTVYIGKRHVHWSFPFNRRYNLPVGLTVENIKVVGNAVYVITPDYPIVLNIGEDKGDDGLQVETHQLIHARYGCRPTSMVSTGWGVMLWSAVGLLAIAGVNVTVASITLVDDDQVGDYEADLCAAYQHGMYFGFRSDGRVILFDVPDPTFGEVVKAPMTTARVAALAVVVTQAGRMLLAAPFEDTLSDWDWTAGDPMTVEYMTYYQKLPCDIVFTAVKVHGDNVDGTLLCYDSVGMRWKRPVRGDTAYRVPATRIRNAVSLRFVGNADIIYNIEVATSMDDLAAV